jgi:hypothetical protein
MRRPPLGAWRAAAALALLVVAAGCGGGTTNDGAITFHGEQEFLPGFSYDTGYQPTPPVQVRLTLSSAGTLTVEAQASGSGSTMTAKPASGRLVLDGHIRVQTAAKIDITGVGQFEGPLPGASNVDLAFGGQTTFDPFLLNGATANLTVEVPETPFEIPLGALPGKLVLRASGTVAAEFAGVCAEAKDNMGRYTGATSMGGTVLLEPSVVLDVSGVGSQTYDVPAITVTIPASGGAMDLGSRALQPGADGGQAWWLCESDVYDGGASDGGASCRLSCAGCCAGNECKAGDEAGACGTGGQECASCHADSPYCVGGVCTGGASCSLTCSGCCAGDQCLDGDTAAACGYGGNACVTCQGADQCINNSCKGSGGCAATCGGCCVGESCQGGTTASACGSDGETCATCPTHYRCGATRACEVDPASLWDVVAVDAQIPALDPNGKTWDPYVYTEPDAYAVITTYVSGAKHLEGKSAVVDDSFAPAWNAVVLAGVTAGEILAGGLGFALYDSDTGTSDDYIDSCSGFVPESDFDAQPHAACGGLIALRYKLVPR